jgi:DNA-binding transcriptional LysR family regulator
VVHLAPPGVGAAPEEDLDVAVVHREPLVAVLPAALAGRVGDRVDLARLSDQRFLTPVLASWGGLRAHLLNACRLAGFEPTVADVRLVHTVIVLIEAGLGVSVLPASAARLVGPRAVVRPLARHVPSVETAVLRRRADQPSPQAQHFLRLALATPEPDVLQPEHARG